MLRAEFPDLVMEENDQRFPLVVVFRIHSAELIKIDPKSRSVGQYQHDLNPKALDEQVGCSGRDSC